MPKKSSEISFYFTRAHLHDCAYRLSDLIHSDLGNPRAHHGFSLVPPSFPTSKRCRMALVASCTRCQLNIVRRHYPTWLISPECFWWTVHAMNGEAKAFIPGTRLELEGGTYGGHTLCKSTDKHVQKYREIIWHTGRTRRTAVAVISYNGSKIGAW